MLWPLVGAALAASAVLAAGGAAYYQWQARDIQAERTADLSAIAALKAEQIASWRAERLADLQAETADPFFRDAVAGLVARPDDVALKARLRQHLRSEVDAGRAHDMLLVGPDRRLLVAADAERTDLDVGERALAAHVAVSRAPRMGDMVRLASGRVQVRTAAPLLDEAGRPFAVLIAGVDPASVLFPAIQAWPTASPSAETMVARREGDEVVYLNTLRHLPDPPLTIRLPVTRVEVPAVRLALRGVAEVFEGVDYRGVPTLADLRPIADSDWLLVTKVDRDELLRELRFRGWTTLLLVLLGIGSSIGVAVTIYIDRHRAVYRDLSVAERGRREALEEIRETLYSIGDGVIATDAAGFVTRMNPVAERLTGWEEGLAAGRPLPDVFAIVNEETRAQVENPVTRVLREGEVVGLANHTLLVSRDGAERPIADSGAPIHGIEGEIKGSVLVFRDQTDERKAMDALKAASEAWQTTFDAMLDPVVLLALDGTITRFNRAFGASFGTGAVGPLVGRRCQDLLFGGVDDPATCPFSRASSTGARATQEMRVGDRLYYVVSDPIKEDPSGKVTATVCALRDITERKRADEERERLQAQLRETWKMESVGRLAGGVAHDFNNMLGVMLGHAELAMADLGVSHAVRPMLEQITRAARHSADLTSQLLAFARKQPIRPTPLDLNHEVSALVPMLRRLVGENIEVVWRPADGLWTVKADPAQIDRVVANLATNARDAIGKAGVLTIAACNTAVQAGSPVAEGGVPLGEYVELSVADTGSGMSPETLAHLFEPFFTTKEVGRGTGLGLATVYGAIRQHNGFIHVDSEPGHGTTFRIYLPRAVEGSQAMQADRGVGPVGGTETILFVEDEPAMLSLGTAILQRYGYTVLAAATPSEALSLAANHEGPIHLLLTDVVMPEMNGKDLRDRLAAVRAGLKVVFMSGYTADVIAQHGVVDAGVDFLQKPFSVASLTYAVREVLDR